MHSETSHKEVSLCKCFFQAANPVHAHIIDGDRRFVHRVILRLQNVTNITVWERLVYYMDLRQGHITLQEILRHPQARALLSRELPQFVNSPLLALAGGMTLNQILVHAKGRVSPEKVKKLLEQLKAL